jgi:hypothetical protein
LKALRNVIGGILVVALLSGCGSGGSSRPEQSGLEHGLGSIGGGQRTVGAGYGYGDLVALRGQAEPLSESIRWAAKALGPGADDIIDDESARLSAGFRPEAADRIVSIAGSYAFGMRFDGVEADPGLTDELVRLGAKASQVSPWTFYDLGGERSRPIGSDLEPLGSLVARTAVSTNSVVLARSDTARADLAGRGAPVTTSPELEAAIACLGPVAAARVLPSNFTYLPNIGPDLIALGVRFEPDGTVHEVFCALDESGSEIDHAAAGMRKSFVLHGGGRFNGRPLSGLVTNAHVSVEQNGDFAVARADLTRRKGQEPGLLFSAALTGELLTYEGLPAARFG